MRLVAGISAIVLVGCGTTHEVHVYRDLPPLPPRGARCDLAMLDELDAIPTPCRMIADVFHAHFPSFDPSAALDAIRESACELGSSLVRVRIVDPGESFRAELYRCTPWPTGTDEEPTDEEERGREDHHV